MYFFTYLKSEIGKQRKVDAGKRHVPGEKNNERSIESAFKKHSRDMTDYKTIVIVA